MSEFITKHEIKKLMALRAQMKALAEQLEVVQAAEGELESVVARKIDAGAPNRSGFDLSVRRSERRYPKWKEAFIFRVTELGEDGAREAGGVLKATEPTIYRAVLIEAAQVRRKAAA